MGVFWYWFKTFIWKKYSKSKQTKYSGFIKLGVRWAERDKKFRNWLLDPVSKTLITIAFFPAWTKLWHQNISYSILPMVIPFISSHNQRLLWNNWLLLFPRRRQWFGISYIIHPTNSIIFELFYLPFLFWISIWLPISYWRTG